MSATCLGRDREVAEVLAALGAAESGRGALVLVEGEAGIGKTTLVQEALTRARVAGAAVAWGQCREHRGAPPFWPWRQVLRALVADIPASVVQRYVGDGAPYLARAVPEVVRSLSPVVPAPTSEQARFSLFDAVASFVRRRAIELPLLIVLDDLHAADPPSLDLLAYLGPELARTRAVIVGTRRDRLPSPEPRGGDAWGEIMRHAVRLTLGGLSAGASTALVSELTAGAATAEVVAELYRLTDGHPLFLRELVRLVDSTGDPGAARALRGLTSSIRHTIEARLAPLDADVRALLACAAVLGRRFEPTVLAEMVGLPPKRVLAALGATIAVGVVDELNAGAARRFEFTHALFREALYQDMPPEVRVARHAQAGEALERLYGQSGERLADIAYHFSQAADGGDVARAATYAMRAGDWASKHLAFAEAADHYAAALHWLKRLPADQQQRCELLITLAEARFRAGDGERASTAFIEAVELARPLDDADLLAKAVLAYTQPWDLPGGVVDEPRVAALEDALAALGQRRHRLRARLHARLGVELYFADPISRAEGHARSAVGEAQQLHDPRLEAEALISWHFTLWRPLGSGNLDARLQLAERIQTLTHHVGDPELRLRGRIWYLQSLLEAGDLTTFDTELGAFTRTAEALHLPVYLSLVPTWQATRSLLRGEFATAERHAQEALTIGRRVNMRPEAQPIAVQTFGVQQYMLCRERGRLKELEPVARATVEALPNMKSWWAALALLYAETGRADEARAIFEMAAVDEFGGLREDGAWFAAMGLLAAVCVRLDDADRSAVLYRRLHPYRKSHVTTGWGVAYLGTVSHYLGKLATVLELFDAAEDHFEDALRSQRRIGTNPWVARTEFHYAVMLRRRGHAADHPRAVQLLTSASTTATSLGMRELARRAEEVEQVVPADGARLRTVSSPRQRPPATPGCSGVLRREGEIWTVGLRPEIVRLRDTKGLRHIAELVRHQGREVHVLDLVAAADGVGSQRTPRAEAAQAGLQPTRASEVSDGPDLQARVAYRRRIEALELEIADTEVHGDPDRLASLRAEQELLAAELSNRLGIGSRRASPEAERARVAVTNAVRRAMRRMGEQAPSLATHFERALSTGLFCSYTPSAQEPICWDL